VTLKPTASLLGTLCTVAGLPISPIAVAVPKRGWSSSGLLVMRHDDANAINIHRWKKLLIPTADELSHTTQPLPSASTSATR
jgi:hypothetical protein